MTATIRTNFRTLSTTGAALGTLGALAAFLVPVSVADAAPPPTTEQAGQQHGHEAQNLPALDEVLLRHVISGLPNHTVTSAQVRISGTGGVWSGTSGVAEIGTHRPVPADGTFRIGSATKMFTAVVVLQLAAEGRVELDRPVQHYLPGLLPPSYAHVSIRQLLDHTSGLPASREDEPASDPAWFVAHRFAGWTPQQVLDSAFAQPMEFAPGSKQHYNGVNYFVAGLLIEKLTGHSYADEVRRRILRPLDLAHTYVPVDNDPRLRGRHAHGYVDVAGTLVDITEQSPYSWAEGGMISSSADLTRFVVALLHGGLLPPVEQRDLLGVPDVEYTGGGQCSVGPQAGRACFSAGLQRTTFPNGVTVWGKSGAVPGYTTAAFATRDLRRVLVYSLTPTGNRDGSEGSYVQNLAGATFDPALVTAQR